VRRDPVDAFLPNLVVFAVGQATAWFHLRTGRWLAGGLLSAVVWILADWALVAKHAFDAKGVHLWLPLLAMQGTALGAGLWLGARWWWRRRSPTGRQRPELFRDGLAAYLRGDLEAAAATFRRLVRNDPWDAAAWIAAGNVARRAGRLTQAKRCWWRGLGVDRDRVFPEFVAHLRSLPSDDAGIPMPVEAPAADGVARPVG